jgi:isocitrate lyase
MAALFEQETVECAAWMSQPRFDGTTRLHSAAQVVEQRGTIPVDYPVARSAAAAFHEKLRGLFEAGRSITTFGPYSPGQAVAMKRLGIEGIYLGGWATSAKGSAEEDPGADLASYPLSQVPEEAASIVRALLTADKNQRFARSHMSAKQLAATPEVDYRPFIIADADTGHGGDAHVRNLVRRFVEVGVPGYHIEDQKPGVKKCGHQGGKVLVGHNEQILRLNAARLQLDIMGVPGLIVARTDAEAANLIDSNGDERDHAFILGATSLNLPSYKAVIVGIHRRLNELGVEDVRGHLMFAQSDADYAAACEWLTRAGVMTMIVEGATRVVAGETVEVDAMFDAIVARAVEAWQTHADVKTYPQAIAKMMAERRRDGESFDMTEAEWTAFSRTASLSEARARALDMGLNVTWDPEIARTPEGYYQVRGGLEYAISRSLSAAPFADLLWMETNSANLHEAAEYATAIHAQFPDKMLAYNLSPSFNWDTTGMTDDEMKAFPQELGKLGFVFNFITYGGHQIDGLAAEEFATALRSDGMLALARLQRKFRLLESPYRTPQTLAGGPRLDAALMASSGRTATTKAMGKGSTQHQHLVETEASPQVLDRWLEMWAAHYGYGRLRTRLRPLESGSDLLQLDVIGEDGETTARVVFDSLRDRRGRSILSVRDQLTTSAHRQKRLMTLVHIFLIHRYRASSVHYLTPTDDNNAQALRMKELGIFDSVRSEIGQIIVATVAADRVAELVSSDSKMLDALVRKAGEFAAAS